jgi:hypothetical protein
MISTRAADFHTLDLHWHLKKWAFEFFQFVPESVRDFCQRKFHYNGAIINSTCSEYMDKISAENMLDCFACGPLFNMTCDIEKTINDRSGQIRGFLCGSLIRSLIVATWAERERRDGAGLIMAKSLLKPTWAETSSRGNGRQTIGSR